MPSDLNGHTARTTPQARIAARSGLIPTMFITRVRLPAIQPRHEARHQIPRRTSKGIIAWEEFSHSLDPKQKRNQTNLYSFAFGRYLRIMTYSVLLDLDGTLIDSHPGILASCLAALRALGHEPDKTLDIRRTIGPPLEDMMQILLQSYGDDRVGEAVAAYRQHYGESGLLGSVPYPGIGKSLEEMKRTGLRIYLATSKRAIFASRILDHLKFATYFDGIYGSVPSGELDHKPELLAHILSKHSLSPSHSLMVGDRRYDISGAHAVGMRGLGVLWGYGTRDELETAGADQLVDSPADLARTVFSMVNGKESPG